MPEFKRNFLKGKMNKDLDERLVPNGEYRDALNIEISSSEGSNVGSVQTLRGNKAPAEIIKYGERGVLLGKIMSKVSSNASTVAVHEDVENGYIYNFIGLASDYNDVGLGVKSDAIVRHSDEVGPGLLYTEHVFTDVFEVSVSLEGESAVANSSTLISGFSQEAISEVESAEQGLTISVLTGVRANMKVDIEDANGSSVLGSHEVRVVKVQNSVNGAPSVITTSFPSSGTIWGDGYKIKFSSERLLKFPTTVSLPIFNGNGAETKLFLGENILESIKVNTIDDFLFFTDGVNEPKKINVSNSAAGTSEFNSHTRLVKINKHTKAIVSASFYAEESHITVIKPNPTSSLYIDYTADSLWSEEYGALSSSVQGTDTGGSDVSWLSSFNLTNSDNQPLEPGDVFYLNPTLQTSYPEGAVVKIVGQSLGYVAYFLIDEAYSGGEGSYRCLLQSISDEDLTQADTYNIEFVDKQRIYEDSFVSFAYRYIYTDGEYSCISPYTNPMFIPSAYSYSSKDAFNLGMINRVKSITLKNFRPKHIPEDVIGVDLIFKETNSSNTYVFKTLYIGADEELDAGAEGDNLGSLTIDSKVFGTTMPSNQLSRVYDDVPKSAVAQEIVGNRLMFGNYKLNYDVGVQPDVHAWCQTSNFNFKLSSTSDNTFHAVCPSSAPSGTIVWSDLYGDQEQGVNDHIYNRVIGFNEVSDNGNNFTSNKVYEAPAAGTYNFKSIIQGPVYKTNDGNHDSRLRISLFECNADGTIKTSNNIPTNRIASGTWRWSMRPLYQEYSIWSSALNGQWDENGAAANLYGAMFDTFGSDFMVMHGFVGFEESVYIDPTVTPYVGFVVETHGWAVGVDSGDYAAMQASDANVQLAYLRDFPSDSNLSDYGRFISVDQAPSTTNLLPTLTGTKSVKSERKYHVGVVYLDKFGRESTVLTSENGEVDISKQNSNNKNFIKLGIDSRAPSWATHYKLYIKELAGKYHNMVLETAFDNNDDSESFAWLVFNSADRNKVKVGDYLSLKKQYGSHDSVASADAEWKIIDIKNEGTSTTTDGVTEVSVGGTTIDTAIIGSASELIGKFFVKVHKDVDFNNYVLKNTTFGALDSSSGNNGAVFETKTKNELDLDLYYEATEAYPIKLDEKNAEHYIPVGSRVEFHGSNNDSIENPFSNHEVVGVQGASCFDGKVKDSSFCLVTLSDDVDAISFGLSSSDYYQVKFVREDGSYTTAMLGQQHVEGNVLKLVPYSHNRSEADAPYDHHSRSNKIMLPWFNCISFGNGVESDTIRDDFNEAEFFPYVASGKQSGFKASIPLESYREVDLKNEIIFSGIFNSKNSVNDTNQFLSAEKITKILNPDNGNIRALSARDGDLLAFCENSTVKILSQKDALYNADGNPQLISSNNVLGQAVPFSGEYGLTGSATSLVKNEFRYYFCDKENGAVLRLSRDGITTISDYGMADWFSDNLKTSTEIIGSFDDKKSEYNLTIKTMAGNRQLGQGMVVYTLSFNENTNSWVSFKSFTKEKGISHKNSYYTFNNAKPYIHHSDFVNRNNFYGIDYNSTIDVIVNEDHSSVKNFKTINYEGSQSKITAFTEVDVDGISYSDKEYYNLTGKEGWYVDSIQTDMQKSSAIEFREKEGKWFNSIGGEIMSFSNYDGASQTNAYSNIDFSKITTQGLGIIQGYSDEGNIALPGTIVIPAQNPDGAGWSFQEFSYQGTDLDPTTEIQVGLTNTETWFPDPLNWSTITTSTNEYIDSISFTRVSWYEITMTINWASDINTILQTGGVVINLPFGDGVFLDTANTVNIPFSSSPFQVPHVFDFTIDGNLKSDDEVYEVVTEIYDEVQNLYSLYSSQYVDGVNFNDSERFLCNYNIPISNSFTPIKRVTLTAPAGRFLDLDAFDITLAGQDGVSDLQDFDNQTTSELYGKPTQQELVFNGAASINAFLTYVIGDSQLLPFVVNVSGVQSKAFEVYFNVNNISIPEDATSGAVNFTSNYSGNEAYSVIASTNPGSSLTNLVLNDDIGKVSFTVPANTTASDITYVLDIIDLDSNVLSSLTVVHSALALPNTVNLIGKYAISADSNTLNFDGDIEGSTQGDTNGDYRYIVVQTNLDAEAPTVSSFKLSDNSALPDWIEITSISLDSSDSFWSYYKVDFTVSTPHISTSTRTAAVKCVHSDGVTSSTNNITVNQYRTYDSTVTDSNLGLSVDDIVITDSEGTPLAVNNVGAIGTVPNESLDLNSPLNPNGQSNFTNTGPEVSADGGEVSFYIKKIGGAELLYAQQEPNVCGIVRLDYTEYNTTVGWTGNIGYDTVYSGLIGQDSILELNADGTPQTYTGSIANGSPTLYKVKLQVNPMPSNAFSTDAIGLPRLIIYSTVESRSILARFLFGNGLHSGSLLTELSNYQYNASVVVNQKAPIDCTLHLPNTTISGLSYAGGMYKTNGFTGDNNDPIVATDGPFTGHYFGVETPDYLGENQYQVWQLAFCVSPRLRSKIKYICWYDPMSSGSDGVYSTDKIFVDYETYSSSTCPGVEGTNANYGPSWVEIPSNFGPISSTVPYSAGGNPTQSSGSNVSLKIAASANYTLATRKFRLGVFLEGNTQALVANDYANIVPDSEIEIIQQPQ